MISTTNNFAITCWYKHPIGERTKALLFDISNGCATLLLESGKFLITDHIEHITVDGASNIFRQCKWVDGGNE